MKKIQNKSGFTLIEIIVVLIIVGVLASIALPNIFGNIQKSKSSQALSMMDSYKDVMESCLASNSSIAPNTAPCTLAGQNLATTVNGWTFSIATAAVAQSATAGTAVAPAGTYLAGTLAYTMSATDGTNTITLTRATAGTWTCSTGTSSPYTGVC